MKKMIIGRDQFIWIFGKNLLVKKIFKIVLILIIMINTKIIYAEEVNDISNDEIISQQQQELGISNFINLSNKYTKDSLEGVDIKEIFNSAITGRIGNTNLFNNILNLLGKEFKNTISTLRYSYYHYYHT